MEGYFDFGAVADLVLISARLVRMGRRLKRALKIRNGIQMGHLCLENCESGHASRGTELALHT